MTTDQLIKTYNPTAVAHLTKEQIDNMKNLTDEQIKILAEAYPNTPSANAYLVLFDTKLDFNKQLFSLSTWSNLHRLHSKQRMVNYRPYTFRELFVPERQAKAVVKTKIPSAKPIDLSAKETEGLPGLTNAGETKTPDEKLQPTTIPKPKRKRIPPNKKQ